ncbi:MAG: ABC transporter ATP-binding protein [Thermoanaerobaculia bacterium]
MKADAVDGGDLRQLAWRRGRLAEMLEELARRCGHKVAGRELPAAPPGLAPAALEEWIERAARWLGAEAEPVECGYRDLDRFVRRVAPAVLRLPPHPERQGDTGTGEPRFLALVANRGRRLEVLTPELEIVTVPAAELAEILRRDHQAPAEDSVDRLLDQTGVTGRKAEQARRALLERFLGVRPVDGCWLLRPAAGGSFLRQLTAAGFGPRLAGVLGTHVLYYGLWIGSWFLIGRGALGGAIDRGWLWAWALMLATLVPVSLLGFHLQGRLVIDFGLVLKRRLLRGASRLPLEDIRRRGSGELLGRVIESEAFEALILSGGFMAATAAVEVLMVLAVLQAGAGGLPHALTFAVWALLAAALAVRYTHRLSRTTDHRLSLTLALVERMVGYRTRLAQQAPERWHDGEDQSLRDYHGVSTALDHDGARLAAGVSRGWLVAGTLVLAPAFLSDPGVGSLAVALGGNLLAFAAVAKLTSGMMAIAAAAVAWKQVAPLMEAASGEGVLGDPAAALTTIAAGTADDGDDSAIRAENLWFRYPGAGDRVLRGVDLDVRRGDRILLEGPSGSGKSTLLSLLTGLRQPDSGLLLLSGFDRPTLGEEAWRSRLAAAPQFHENHVLDGTMAFNLLLGRRWPPTLDDLKEAAAVCRELGLGELLERMPGGLHQMVGETGWQLSHGERSRVYLARALLQGADVVVLDESFGALDPESLRRALATTLERSPTLIAVAHP